ncbi:hypothetical protein FACS189443_5240 [Planctomycetales bacterium]|nr:hypothetical protein FACS189443_5240 [Planctomycetales bacterium]
MPVSLDCVLCLTRQSLEAARFATPDENRHTAVLKSAFDIVRDIGFTTIPPIVAQQIQRVIRLETGNNDPYREQKYQSNVLMMSVRDKLSSQIAESGKILDTAVHLAIAGNAIDYAVKGDWDSQSILEVFQKATQTPINGSVAELGNVFAKAKNVLYLLDNCGEIVCDQLLIETLQTLYKDMKITAVVRGLPVLNDAVLEDAKLVGLDRIVPVIDNGNDAVGTILEQCGEKFHNALRQCDLIIAKGLANYETLVEYNKKTLPMPIAYLFKAKCQFIAKYAGVQLNDLVIRVV